MIEKSLSLVTSSMRVTLLEEPVNTWVLWNFIKNKRSKALPWLLRAEPETCRPRPGQWPRHTSYWLMAVEELRHSEANPWDHTGEWVHVAASRYSTLIDDVVSLVVQPILCNVKEQRPIQRGMVLNPSPNPLLAPSCPVLTLASSSSWPVRSLKSALGSTQWGSRPYYQHHRGVTLATDNPKTCTSQSESCVRLLLVILSH